MKRSLNWKNKRKQSPLNQEFSKAVAERRSKGEDNVQKYLNKYKNGTI